MMENKCTTSAGVLLKVDKNVKFLIINLLMVKHTQTIRR